MCKEPGAELGPWFGSVRAWRPLQGCARERATNHLLSTDRLKLEAEQAEEAHLEDKHHFIPISNAIRAISLPDYIPMGNAQYFENG